MLCFQDVTTHDGVSGTFDITVWQCADVRGNFVREAVSRRIGSKDAFISNAAHRLRSPIAGVPALAEAFESAPDETSAKRRSRELLQVARETSRLANQLLLFERARGSGISLTGEPLDICAFGGEVVKNFSQWAVQNDVEVSLFRPEGSIMVFGDPVILKEALLNLLTNALVHGGTLDVGSPPKGALVQIALPLATSGKSA